ncbi:hypothetical protein PVAP13_9KG433100 [Panicum virgatum]|uniref:DWNN domain-containing protein n=1 Tax=Panicum virgatum TaxID=38727 RepID=A0A8T0NYA9_PANVG|nr:hypothetical protein PVAP13_9KG433100 [Panicum virgatum]
MAVYYRYKSGVETFSVPVPAPSVSVADLKSLILRTARHGHGRTRGRGQRESVALHDARTGEEYTDGSALVPRNSTVLVRRVAGPPAETITVAPSPPPPKVTTRDGAPSGSAVTSTSSAEDEETRAISAVIDAAQLKWGDQHRSQGGRRYGHHGALEARAPPPAGYVCHRCRIPGHFIQHCPTNGDPRYDLGRTPSTKINLPAPSPVAPIPEDGVPPELHCKICSKVMTDAVVASRCCFGSFCDVCIRAQIAAKSRCVGGAQSRAADLIPNLTLRATIAKLLATSASGSGSVGTDNRKSSAGSKHSAAASQEGSSHATAAAAGSDSGHSDGSASSTSKSAAAPAAREPVMKRTTAAESAEIGAQAGYPEQYGYYGSPFGPACYDPFFGAAPWACDPYMYYGMPYGGGYTDVPAAPAGYHDGCQGRKRMADGELQRHGEAGFKRRCGGRSEVAF